jgi:hypothetical protein
MYNISHKYKRFLFLIVKLTIVVVAIYFIYEKLANNQLLTFLQLKNEFLNAFDTKNWTLILLLILTDINWFLEIFKWKTLVSIIKKITFFEAFEQSLASLTTAIITPNKIGEYGAKALYFEKQQRKKIVFLNFIGNIVQLATTVFFGIIGMVFFLNNFVIETQNFNHEIIIVPLTIFLFLLVFRNKLGFNKLKNYLHKILSFLKNISPYIYLKIVGFSFFRYLVFSHQFYFFLIAFGVETDYFTLMNLIFCMYFIASFIPSFTIFDWAVKGSVALWIFHFIGLNELTVVTVTTLMWIFNFAIPALFGSVFVLNYKSKI